MHLKVAVVVSNLLLYCTWHWMAVLRMFTAPTATMTIGSGCPEIMWHHMQVGNMQYLLISSSPQSRGPLRISSSNLSCFQLSPLGILQWNRVILFAVVLSQYTRVTDDRQTYYNKSGSMSESGPSKSGPSKVCIARPIPNIGMPRLYVSIANKQIMIND